MRRYIPALLLLSLAACNGSGRTEETPDSGLLSTGLVHNPRTAEGTDNAVLKDMPVLQFTDTVHDFGTIPGAGEVSYDFAFTNTGKAPLVISDIRTSCGCTVADFPRDPVLPGEGGALKVRFRPDDNTGHQEKTVSVNANTFRGVHVLRIRAEVAAKQ